MTMYRISSGIVVFVILCGWASILCAQEDDGVLQDIDQVKDPFVSQLPEPKVVPKPVLEDTRPEIPQIVEKDPVETEPVLPLVAPPVSVPNIDSFVLMGLVWNTDTPQAIVNDKVVKVGDEINGIRVAAIHKNGVEFTSNGVTMMLKMSEQNGPAVRKP